MNTTIPTHKVQPGDRALHINNRLDARTVTRVQTSIDHSSPVIWIDINETEVGPVPAANYTFTRPA